MSIRTVRYELDENGSFAQRIDCIGVQYEDNATAVEYELNSDFEDALLNISGVTGIEYRIDFDTDAYGYNPSEVLQSVNGVVRREIPQNVTRSNECRVNLVAIAYGDEGVITTVSTPQSKIHFARVIRTDLAAFSENLPDLAAFTVYFKKALQDIAAKKTAVESTLADIENNISFITTAKNYCANAQASVEDALADIEAKEALVASARNYCASVQGLLEDALEDIETKMSFITSAKDYCTTAKNTAVGALADIEEDKSIILSAKNYCADVQDAVTEMAQSVSAVKDELDEFILSELALPEVTASDNGKFLRVVNGSWSAANVSDGSGVDF